MSRSSRIRALSLACVFGLSAFSSATSRAHAHDHSTGHPWCLLCKQPPIPRTYSYYYPSRLNQPHHFRVQRPDGSTFWRTTVRGLPLGTPWPSR